MVRRAPVLLVFAVLAFSASPVIAATAGAGAQAPPAAAAGSGGGAKAAAAPAGAKGAASAVAFEPRIYMSWNAPYGRKGASATRTATCGDTLGADTLYLSVDPGRTSPDFRGVSAILYFHAAEGSVLGDFWKTAGRGIDGSPLSVTFDGDATRGFDPMGTSKGVGAPKYDFVAGSGRLRMIYAFPGGPEKALERGHRYGFARVIVHRPAVGQGGCGDPICVEWHSAKFAYAVDEEHDVNEGERWVSLNSPDGTVCAPSREATGTAAPWKPKAR